MEETLILIGRGINGKLTRTLESTNPCESMIDCVGTTQRNVKHWFSGEMGLRCTAAGVLEAEKQFPRPSATPPSGTRDRDRARLPP
jgi:putative transposase